MLHHHPHLGKTHRKLPFVECTVEETDIKCIITGTQYGYDECNGGKERGATRMPDRRLRVPQK